MYKIPYAAGALTIGAILQINIMANGTEMVLIEPPHILATIANHDLPHFEFTPYSQYIDSGIVGVS